MCNFYLDRSYVHRTELADVMKGCQFQAQIDEPDYKGYGFCKFHLPDTYKTSWTPQEIDDFNHRILDYLKQGVERGGLIDLSGVVFPGDFVIEPSKSDRKLALPRMLLLECIFMGGLEIRDTIFIDMTAWNKSRFLKQPIFDNVIFSHDVEFSGATMPGAFFSDCRFYQGAYFQATTFASDVTFANCVFRGRVWYINAIFNGFDRFINCEFQGEADFTSFLSSEQSSAGGNSFSYISFENVEFYSRANFSNRQFRTTTAFSSVTFHIAPEFYGCSLHQDTDFSKTTFLDRGRQGGSWNHEIYTESVDAAKAYRTLKLAMGFVRNKEAEGRFYAYEQECIRADKNTPLAVRLLSNGYRLTSGYGQSITRPLISIVITFLVFGVLYWMLIPPIPFQASEIGVVTRFALQQLAQPWSLAQASNMPIYVLVLVIIQSLLYVIFVFLIVLAVKRRFEMS